MTRPVLHDPDGRELVVYAIPLATRFRGLDVRDGMLIRGAAGWAEFSPFWDYDDAESAAWLRCALAIADHGLPAGRRETIPVNVTVPATTPERAERIVAASGGCRTAKVKVAERGQDLAADLDRVAAVRAALGPGGRIRVDANGGWDVRTAAEAITALDRAAGGLEYVEQPCARVDDLARVRRLVTVPVAADESIRRAADPYAVARAEAADIMIVKVQPLGGIDRCLDLVADIGLPAVVSSALETSIGIAAGLALAAALPGPDRACGLATVNLLTADVVTTPLRPVGGELPVRPPEVDEAALRSAAASRPLTDRWLDRYRRVTEELRRGTDLKEDGS